MDLSLNKTEISVNAESSEIVLSDEDKDRIFNEIDNKFKQIALCGEKEIIAYIESVENFLKKSTIEILFEDAYETVHRFSDGVYLREVHIPADNLVVGKLHKYEHLNFISQGEVTVLTKDGAKHYVAPVTIMSSAGTKRILYTHKDTIWSVIHPNRSNTTDLIEIENEHIAKNYNDLLIESKESVG